MITPNTSYSHTRRSVQRFLQAGIVLGMAFALSACGHTSLTHFDGTPFLEHGPRTTIENGWVAVDSCAAGYHAQVTLEIETAASSPLLLQSMTPGLPGGARQVRTDGPRCWTENSSSYLGKFDGPPGTMKSDWSGGQKHCVYRVRAEYTLDTPLTAADSVLLVLLDR